jgi:hypothetical protein
MAVTARFVADFSDFLSAARSAEGALGKLSASAGVTERSVDKAAKAFGGESLIANAIKATEAVTAIGGASKLTDTEMARVNRTITDAIDKMTKLGIAIPPEISKIGKELESALKPSVFERMTGGLAQFGLSLGTVSAGALLAFGKGAINAADNIGDIAEKTGLSTTAVQQFQQAFEGAGISLETIATSAAKLSAKVAGGSDSTEAALTALGLSMVDLRTKSPEEAFKLVSTALAGVDDQGKKTLLATELLGKGMAASAGAFNKANIAAMEHADILGGDSVEAAGAFNDAQTHLTRSLQNALLSGIGPLLPALTMLADLGGKVAGLLGGVLKFAVDGLVLSFNVMRQSVADSLVSLIEMIQKLPFASKIPGAEKLGEAISFLKDQSQSAGQAIAAHLNPAMDKSASGTETLSARIGEYKDNTKEASAAVREHAKELENAEKAQKKFLASVTNLNSRFLPFKESIEDVGESLHNLPSVSFADFASESSKARIEAEKLAQSTSGVLATSIRQVSPALAEAAQGASKFSGAVAGLGATIVSAFQGGGDPFKAIGASLGSAFGEDIGAKAAKAIGGKLGSSLGSAMGPLGGLLGGLLGAGMSKAMGWIKGLFSDPMKKEIEAANAEMAKLKSAMMEQGGSVEELEARYNAMGLSIREAFGGQGLQGVAALKAAQELFNQRVDESKIKLDEMKGKLSGLQTELTGLIGKANEMGFVFNQQGELIGFNFDKVAQVAKEFGVDLAGLGPAFQQAQLTAESQKVIDAFTLMTMAGGSVGVVLNGMKDEINKIVIDSLQFGTTIPDNMKPMIAQLIKQGDLTDKNGDKITDMGNIKFGPKVVTQYEAINTQIETVLTAMNDLISKIDAMVSAIDAAMRPRTLVTTAVYVDPGPPPGFGSVDSGGNRNDRRGGDNADVSGDGFATGTMGRFGRWFANFGAGTKTTLHGNEAVVRADQASAFAADMGGDGGGMASEIAGLRADINSLLPRAIGRAVRDAMQMSGAMA